MPDYVQVILIVIVKTHEAADEQTVANWTLNVDTDNWCGTD